VLLLTALAWLPSIAQASPNRSPGTSHGRGKLESVTILTKAGRQTFTAEIATTPAQRERGLMFRTRLAERHGMLFDFGQEQEVRMWMKNTLIPLDMVFIGADGRIHRIEQNARPGSLDLISSKGPVRSVLELKAGTARKYGIEPGDRIIVGASAG